MAKVLVCTSIGPGKEYAIPLMLNTIRHLEGAETTLVVFDGVPADQAERRENEGFVELTPAPSDWSIHGRLARVREVSRRLFLGAESYTHLYWHDSDMVPDLDIIPRLLAHNAPVANGLYYMRGCDPPIFPMMTRLFDPAARERDGSEVDVMDVVDGCMFPLGYGMGCMLVDRATMERTPFREPESYTGACYGEDIQWCLDCGEKILVDTTLPVWHIDSTGDGIRPGMSAAQ